MKRPLLNSITNGQDLKKWYWLKQELVDFCKNHNINYSGGKFDILERIALTLDKDPKVQKEKEFKKKPTSSFNWTKEILTQETIITDSYTNGPNSRKFFIEYCGKDFRFNIPFMAWMRNNPGKKLQDAIHEWKRINMSQKETKSDIPYHNQYNQYIRDFFVDNPGKTLDEARHFWRLKRSLPTGKHFYESSDLDLNDI